jgi:hypothetical protein
MGRSVKATTICAIYSRRNRSGSGTGGACLLAAGGPGRQARREITNAHPGLVSPTSLPGCRQTAHRIDGPHPHMARSINLIVPPSRPSWRKAVPDQLVHVENVTTNGGGVDTVTERLDACRN